MTNVYIEKKSGKYIILTLQKNNNIKGRYGEEKTVNNFNIKGYKDNYTRILCTSDNIHIGKMVSSNVKLFTHQLATYSNIDDIFEKLDKLCIVTIKDEGIFYSNLNKYIKLIKFGVINTLAF